MTPSSEPQTVIILGSRKAAAPLAKLAQPNKLLKHERGCMSALLATGKSMDVSHFSKSEESHGRIRVIDHYFGPTSPTCKSPTLSEIENCVKARMKEMNLELRTICAVVFMASENANEPIIFPFELESSFLGLAGDQLLRKLVFVHTQKLSSNNRLGVHNFFFDKNAESAQRFLDRILAATSHRDLDEVKSMYDDEAAAVGRHARKAAVLLFGLTGHGKSKTINRLVRQNLLPVGHSTLGSTTKVIQRVTLNSFNKISGTSIPVEIDDTPGLEDTTYSDREANQALLYEYQRREFPTGIYPNVILLVAAWDSIIADAHNEPQNLTSAIGKSMYYLKLSGLADLKRPNVVVVVTKSLPTRPFTNNSSAKEDDTKWNLRAQRRIGLITDIQRRVFPDLRTSWEVVFIENGGGTDMSAAYPKLPNGQVSHVNLLIAIRHIIERRNAGDYHDLAGYQALTVLDGDEPLDCRNEVKMDIIVDKSAVLPARPDSPSPPLSSGRILELADQYFGVTYNPVSNMLGHTNVLAGDLSGVKIDPVIDPDAPVDLSPLQQPEDHGSDDVARLALSNYYSTSSAFRSARLMASTTLILNCITYHLTSYSTPALSEEMKDLVLKLPPWSSESQDEYNRFFDTYGSHVVTQVALGGVLRVVIRQTDSNSSDEPPMHTVEIFRDGGGSLASEVTKALEARYSGQDISDNYRSTVSRWMKALETDPVFCPDQQHTQLVPLHDLVGIEEKQMGLKGALEMYMRQMTEAGVASKEATNSGLLQQEAEKDIVHKSFVAAFFSSIAKRASAKIASLIKGKFFES